MVNETLPRVSITQVDREVLDRFMAVVGTGKVYGPYSRATKGRPNSKDCHMYIATGFLQTRQVGEAILPYLGQIKRAQYHDMQARASAIPRRKYTDRKGTGSGKV